MWDYVPNLKDELLKRKRHCLSPSQDHTWGRFLNILLYLQESLVLTIVNSPDGERHASLQLRVCCGSVVVIVVLVTSLGKKPFRNADVRTVIWMQWIWIDHGAKFSGRIPFAERGGGDDMGGYVYSNHSWQSSLAARWSLYSCSTVL